MNDVGRVAGRRGLTEMDGRRETSAAEGRDAGKEIEKEIEKEKEKVKEKEKEVVSDEIVEESGSVPALPPATAAAATAAAAAAAAAAPSRRRRWDTTGEKRAPDARSRESRRLF